MSTTTFDATAASAEARNKIEAVFDGKVEQARTEAQEACDAAVVYATHLAEGGDPTRYTLPKEGQLRWTGRSDRIVSAYAGLIPVYERWHQRRGSRNPYLPFQNIETWKLAERFADSIGKPIQFAALKSLFVRSTDTVARALLAFERETSFTISGYDHSGLVVRRTKVDGKVAFLVRERRESDPPAGSYGAGSIPEEA